MSSKPKPCTLGKRHSWAFVKNRIITTRGVRTASISQRGVYRCECGAVKLGEPASAFAYAGGESNG